jgi:hypothetical protein
MSRRTISSQARSQSPFHATHLQNFAVGWAWTKFPMWSLFYDSVSQDSPHHFFIKQLFCFAASSIFGRDLHFLHDTATL